MLCVLVVAAGAPWESAAVTLIGDQPTMTVLRRCVDVEDLLALATTGQADVAVVSIDAPGLDAAAVQALRRHAVRPIAITTDGTDGADERARVRLSRLGIASVVPASDLGSLAAVIRDADAPRTRPPDSEAPGARQRSPLRDPGRVEDLAGPIGDRLAAEAARMLAGEPVTGAQEPAEPSEASATPDPAGRAVVVWGPGGGPGRTTVALGLGAILADRGARALVVDADPYGGTVAQQLGVMDEVSGLLAAARLSGSGDLLERFLSVQRGVVEGLAVITGLPRADRYAEVRPGVVEHVIELGTGSAHVLVDTGFALDEEPGSELGGRPGRNQLTLGALAIADEIIVVGSADPVGLARLARGLVALREAVPGIPYRVVVNRMRPSLGWTDADLESLIAGFGEPASVHYLPEDRVVLDRALVTGRTLVEVGDSRLRAALEEVAEVVFPDLPAAAESGRLARQLARRRALRPERTRRSGRRRAEEPVAAQTTEPGSVGGD